MPTIFILDDDDNTSFAMEFWLKRKGYSVKSFVNANQLLQQVQATVPDVVLLDIHLNGEDGREVCQYLKNMETFDTPVFLISTNTDYSNDFTKCKADGFMHKPYHMKELPDMIQSRITFD